MPRHSKGPRLWRRSARRKNGKIVAAPVWIIKDGDKHISTGCTTNSTERRPPKRAEEALAKYIAEKYQPCRDKRSVHSIDIADVLSIYYEDTHDRQSSSKRFSSRILRLNEFFGGKKLGELNTKLCKDYENCRRNRGGSRRDLEDLRAAVRHHARENLHDTIIYVTLPAKGRSRERYLTRAEAAKLVWTCWHYREKQRVHRGNLKGQIVETEKRPLRHLARFILIGLYTGTRAAAIASASPYRDEGRSFVDLEAGIFYRLAQGKKATKKRQTPVPLPKRLLAHMRRWVKRKASITHFVEWNGKPVKSVKTAFKSAVQKAHLSVATGNVSPHTLRHTAATWLMQNGADPWQAAGFLGMSVKTLIENYGHHHPDFMREAAEAITSKDRKKNVAVVESVVELNRLAEKSMK